MMDSIVNCRFTSSIGKQEHFPHNKFKWSSVSPQSHRRKPPCGMLLSDHYSVPPSSAEVRRPDYETDRKLLENMPLEWTHSTGS